ncbi:TOX high mobility group box family member 4-B isoform X3 [Phyllopteryx taeniolatus]|uniref:TOX high mobility group box family member 4-B isoform X3 n=1 Tax=Phyllopteryx taeniolatus TaxID=161469 RepID=UPI002AD26D58|nr:TOX high mobility group box family member 4-B isoform X3 [Phyllopteryx taeniolatus]
MDLNFYSGLSDGCGQNVDPEFLDSQAYAGYPEGHKFSEGSDSYLTIGGGAHHFLSAEQTFHTPSLGDEVFEIPPISLDPDTSLSISEAVSHFELSDGTVGPSDSRSLVSNLVVGANDPSFASPFVNTGSQGLEHLNMGTMAQANGGALLSSSSLELGNSSGSHFSSTSPMTIDVQLADITHGLLGSGQLSTINQTELALGLGEECVGPPTGTSEPPLSATPSPAGSLQDEDMDDFKLEARKHCSAIGDAFTKPFLHEAQGGGTERNIINCRSVLVDSPMSLSSSLVLSHPAVQSSISLATAKRTTSATVSKTGRPKKDPNEPQKPVSAYALFFKDTQAAIKGQNPNASFGEVSKIVASMWDSLAEEQKQVYKKKTDTANREYLKALAAYRANQLSQPTCNEVETAPSPSQPDVSEPASHQVVRPANNLEENTITNICASNIILDIPERATRSRTGANKPAPAPAAAVPSTQTVTKILIPKHMLQAGGQFVTLLPGGIHTLQPTLVVSGGPRLPPPLQQMQNAPPPPPLQQMAPAPPRLLQAKPREGGSAAGLPVSVTAAPPPPLQIKIVPSSLQRKDTRPIIIPAAATVASTVFASSLPPAVQVVNSAESAGQHDEEVISEVLPSEEGEMEVNESCEDTTVPCMCVRSGCTNPAVESEDWDKEYCSNECVASHCSDIFKAWCSIRSQTMGTVK